MEKHRFDPAIVEFRSDFFEAVAPLGDVTTVAEFGVDCEMCCPGKCTGCTKCNACNLVF